MSSISTARQPVAGHFVVPAEWLDLARREVSSARRSPKQERVVAYYFEHGPGQYVEGEVAAALNLARDTVQTANAKLERAGLLVRERVAKSRGEGYFYSLAVPLPRAVNRMVASVAQGSQSHEQANDARAVNRMVEPNLQGSQSTPSVYVLASTSVVVPAIGTPVVTASTVVPQGTTERERDHAQIAKRIGPISNAAAFAALNAALDADRLGVIECVHEIKQGMREGRVRNPMGLLMTMLREGEHIGKRPAPKICVYCGRPEPTARQRSTGHVLCDHHHAQTTEALLERQRAESQTLTGGGVR